MKPSSERSSERLIRKKKRVADVQAQDEVEVDDGDELPVRKKKKKRPVEVEYDEPVEEKKVKKKKNGIKLRRSDFKRFGASRTNCNFRISSKSGFLYLWRYCKRIALGTTYDFSTFKRIKKRKYHSRNH
jgi:hypothetical protein